MTEGGPEDHGQGYFSLANYDPNFTITRAVVSQSADFGTGLVNGSVTQFVIVPEPGSFMLAACSVVGLVMIFGRRRNVRGCGMKT